MKITNAPNVQNFQRDQLGTSMKNLCKLSLLGLLGLGLTASSSFGGDIIYSIVNNPAVQNGYTLSGTITTDGKTGTIFPSDILAWSFLVSNGVNTYSANSSEPGSSVGMGPAPGIFATSDYLALPSSTVSDPYGFDLVGADPLVQWTGSTLQDGAFTSASRWNGSWPWWHDHITTTPHDVPGGWAIADNGTPLAGPVPDDSCTITLLGMAMTGLAFLRRKL